MIIGVLIIWYLLLDIENLKKKRGVSIAYINNAYDTLQLQKYLSGQHKAHNNKCLKKDCNKPNLSTDLNIITAYTYC